MNHVDEALRILAVRVRERVGQPALVLVSSARAGDGKTYVACGLARASTELGIRTLLLDATPAGNGVADELGEERADALTIATVTPRDQPFPDERQLVRLVEHARRGYQLTIVDSAPIPSSSLAVRFARLADGVLLTVRLGRRPEDADGETAQFLRGESAPLLAVVPTQPRPRRGAVPVRAPLPAFEYVPRVVAAAPRAVQGS